MKATPRVRGTITVNGAIASIVDMRDIPICDHCRAVHGGVQRFIKAGIICERCRGLRRVAHNTARCNATALAYEMCTRGLFSIRRGNVTRNGVWDPITSPSSHAAKILRMFELPTELVPSRHTSGPATDECWTTQEGIDTLLLVQTIARSYLTIPNPAAARLLLAHPGVFEELRALWHLDASRDVLEDLLKPLNADVSAAVQNRLAEVPKLRKRKPCR